MKILEICGNYVFPVRGSHPAWINFSNSIWKELDTDDLDKFDFTLNNLLRENYSATIVRDTSDHNDYVEFETDDDYLEFILTWS